MLDKLGWVILTTVLPISELRGGLPLALSMGFDPLFALILTVFFNSIIFFPVFFGLKLFYEKWFSKIRLANRIVESTRKRGSAYIKKYGVLGLTIFIAIPLPLTGVYSGTILAWLTGFKWKKAFIAASLGALIAGLIVLGISLGVVKSLDWIIK